MRQLRTYAANTGIKPALTTHRWQLAKRPTGSADDVPVVLTPHDHEALRQIKALGYLH